MLAGLALPRPATAAAPFIAASALVHILYFLLVGRLYRNADLSVAYPIMRGLAPLIAALIAFVTLSEQPGPFAVLGVAVPAGGVALMGASGMAHGRIDGTTITVALADAFIVAVYMVIDGAGARISGPSALFAFTYNAWADALTALVYAPVVFALRGGAAAIAIVRFWRRGLVGGLAAFVGYAVVVWAMTRAPIAVIAALRETSVLFAALIGIALLGEPFRPPRAVAALIIFLGVVVLRLA